MIKLSKADFHIQVLVAIIAMVILWIPLFIHIKPITFYPHSFFEECFGWIQTIPFMGIILTLSVMVSSLIILYKILVNNHLQSANTFFPEIIFIVLMSDIFTVQFSAEIISGFLLLLALQPLFNFKEEKSGDHSIFLSSFLIGIATLFQPSLWLCFLLPLMTISIFETLTFRKIMLSLLGFILIWIWFFSIAFLTDSLNTSWQIVVDQASFSMQQFYFTTNIWSWSVMILEIVLFFPIIIIELQHSKKDLVISRRRIYVVVSLLILLMSCLLTTQNISLHQSLLCLPATILISYLYEYLTKVKMVGFCIFLLFLINFIGRWLAIF